EATDPPRTNPGISGHSSLACGGVEPVLLQLASSMQCRRDSKPKVKTSRAAPRAEADAWAAAASTTAGRGKEEGPRRSEGMPAGDGCWDECVSACETLAGERQVAPRLIPPAVDEDAGPGALQRLEGLRALRELPDLLAGSSAAPRSLGACSRNWFCRVRESLLGGLVARLASAASVLRQRAPQMSPWEIEVHLSLEMRFV
ncbi:unnamed protein product, partial [Symbiodinium sp. KB8]